MIVAIPTVLLTAACGSTVPSTAPTAPVPTPPVLAPTASLPAAKSATELEITTFAMKYLRFELDQYVYAPEVILKETSGRSPARLTLIELRMPNGYTNLLGGPCMNSLEVPTAGTWRLTDLAFWCRDVDSPDDISGSPVSLRIVYADQDGVSVQVSG
jgi:hypothetical protein